MAGLARLCKQFGSMKIGDTTMLWDYVADKAVPEAEMPFGSERHKLSERARWLQNPPRNALQCAARACPGCNVCSKTPNVRGEAVP